MTKVSQLIIKDYGIKKKSIAVRKSQASTIIERVHQALANRSQGKKSMEQNTSGYHVYHTIHSTYYIPVHAHATSLWARLNTFAYNVLSKQPLLATTIARNNHCLHAWVRFQQQCVTYKELNLAQRLIIWECNRKLYVLRIIQKMPWHMFSLLTSILF